MSHKLTPEQSALAIETLRHSQNVMDFDLEDLDSETIVKLIESNGVQNFTQDALDLCHNHRSRAVVNAINKANTESDDEDDPANGFSWNDEEE